MPRSRSRSRDRSGTGHISSSQSFCHLQVIAPIKTEGEVAPENVDAVIVEDEAPLPGIEILNQLFLSTLICSSDIASDVYSKMLSKQKRTEKNYGDTDLRKKEREEMEKLRQIRQQEQNEIYIKQQVDKRVALEVRFFILFVTVSYIT